MSFPRFTAQLLLVGPLAASVHVYPPVPGLAASEHYSVRIRPVGGKWQQAFAWQTACKTEPAYFEHLAGWTHTYVNFETSEAVEVEISQTKEKGIQTAKVRPEREIYSSNVENGKVVVKLEKPGLVAVDINGQMEGQDTGKGYKGPPIHTISLFANPPLAGKPSPESPRVRLVKPGEQPNTDGDWQTLYFLPGVHDIGASFPVQTGRQYYIPGDAMVYGSFHSKEWKNGRNIRLFGHGTLSGARLPHLSAMKDASEAEKNISRKPIEIFGAKDTKVEGLTVADSASHSIMLINGYEAEHPNTIQWTKIFTWRANGDGINPFGNTLIEDCFLRTQDDSLYVNGHGIRRCVLWNDANGSSFVLSSLSSLGDRKLIVEDCDVIYARAKWHRWSGGRVFNMRGENDGPGGAGVVFRNIRITDPRPTLQQFFLCQIVPTPYDKDGAPSKPGDISGIHFQNVSITAPSVLGEPQMLWGDEKARLRNFTFENLTLGGKPVKEASFFKMNTFVDGMKFEP
jgi:hypothetical protein